MKEKVRDKLNFLVHNLKSEGVNDSTSNVTIDTGLGLWFWVNLFIPNSISDSTNILQLNLVEN